MSSRIEQIIEEIEEYIDSCKTYPLSSAKIIVNKDGEFLLNSEMFTYITEFIRKINGIPEGERINPEDEWAKQILIEDEREKLKKQAKKTSNRIFL